MRWILLCLCLLAAAPAVADVTVTTTTTVTSAQQDAETMARTGVLRHCGRAGGRREGIGFSTVSPDHAMRNCCFWGKYRPREIGVARGRRGWYACIRYE
jgi:hypothetical protein